MTIVTRCLTVVCFTGVCVATARAAPGAYTKVALVPFADGKGVTFAPPNGPGYTLLPNGTLTTTTKKTLLLDRETKRPTVRRYAMITEGDRVYFVLEYQQPEAAIRQRPIEEAYKGRVNNDVSTELGVAALDFGTGDIVWRTTVNNWHADGAWELVNGKDALYFRTLDGATAVGKSSGKWRWKWSEDAHQGGLNDRYLLSWKFVDRSILFECKNRVDFEMHPEVKANTYELDAETGLRTYRVTREPTIKPRPIYVWQHQIVEYPGDRPAPSLPTTFDGLWMERTALLWNKQTREGIILNPELAILDQIVKVAQQQAVGGKPIQWKYVIDIAAASHAFPPDRMRDAVMNGYKDPVAPDDEILYWPLAELEFSGEKIVAAELAKRLGAATLPTPTPEKTALAAAPIFVFRDDHVHERASLATNDYMNHIKLKWGPYVFYQRTPDWSQYRRERFEN